MSKKNYKTLELDAKYKPKASEKYMSDEQRAYFYKTLSEQREELITSMDDVMGSINISTKSSAAGGKGDDGDFSNLISDADMQIRTHERHTNLLRKIDSALERLESGKFGYSVISGEEIGLKRMIARPLATLTIEEQEEQEKIEK